MVQKTLGNHRHRVRASKTHFKLLYLDLYRRSFEGSIDHGQHTVLDVLCWCFGQQQVHLLQEDQQDLHNKERRSQEQQKQENHPVLR